MNPPYEWLLVRLGVGAGQYFALGVAGTMYQ